MWAARNAFLTAGLAGPEGDLYWDNVTLLLNGGGSNTFTDFSSSNRTITNNGATTTSANIKFPNTYSMLFDGTSDYLTVPTSTDFAFGSGDFTIEGWFNSTKTTRQEVYSRYNGNNASSWGVTLNYSATRSINFYIGNTIVASSAGSVWTSGEWNHFAVARSGSTLKMFINGVEVASVSNSTNITDNGLVVYLGIAATYYFSGYMQDMRITKGVARYTANFTPPTKAFPVGQ